MAARWACSRSPEQQLQDARPDDSSLVRRQSGARTPRRGHQGWSRHMTQNLIASAAFTTHSA